MHVGLINQLRGMQRAIDQVAIILDAIGKKVKGRQGDQQHGQQAAAQQGENLGFQGFL
ncbi:hypothetical protein ABIC88_001330 [Pseudomonas kilonensis]